MRFLVGILLFKSTVSSILGKCIISSLVIENGYSNLTADTVVTLGTVVNLTCNQGYNIVGEAILRCGEDGQWSPSRPSCEPVHCGEVGDIMNGEFVREIGTGSENVFGTKLLVKCNNNTVLNGSVVLTCSTDGSWGTKPMCVESECGNHPGLNTWCTEKTVLLRNGSLVYHCKNSSTDMAVTNVGNGISSCNDTWIQTNGGCFCEPVKLRLDRKKSFQPICYVALSCILSLIIYHLINDRKKLKDKLFNRFKEKDKSNI